jgi:hypothetical protein
MHFTADLAEKRINREIFGVGASGRIFGLVEPSGIEPLTS